MQKTRNSKTGSGVFFPIGPGAARQFQPGRRPIGKKTPDPLARSIRLGFAVLAIAAACGLPAGAAEIQIRGECRPSGAVVTLGDCATISAAAPTEETALASVELLPAPPVGQTRPLRAREIQDLLLLRGIDLRAHRFSGFSQLTVHGPTAIAEPGAIEPLAAAAARRIERQVQQAVLAYLEQTAGADQSREVQVSVTDELARRIQDAGGITVVHGGAPPWSGMQRLQIALDGENASDGIALDVQVRAIPATVVTTRSLPRGAVITAADVALRRDDSGRAAADCFHAAEQVIGSETTQAIGEATAIDRRMVRAPQLVRRGEIVTVYARSGGIRVRTTARARDDGSLDELIGVETLADRKTFFARVSGIRELEIYARGAQAATVADAGNGVMRHDD
ncbi:MAG: flagellar basal body P-ring formation protein FlgA [Rhodopirellula sp.]|nr:flagellar basal body P-ring formation protein FlgA [Rhodopirellula sp.]